MEMEYTDPSHIPSTASESIVSPGIAGETIVFPLAVELLNIIQPRVDAIHHLGFDVDQTSLQLILNQQAAAQSDYEAQQAQSYNVSHSLSVCPSVRPYPIRADTQLILPSVCR